MSNWDSGWRRLVTWDANSKCYLYKDKQILPLSFKEQRDMPIHLQNEYYWDEINHIDKIYTLNNDDINEYNENDVQEAFNEWWQLVES